LVKRWTKVRHILQAASSFYLWKKRVRAGGRGYVSQIESLKKIKLFGTAPATAKTFLAQQLGTQFGDEGDQNLRPPKSPCEPIDQPNTEFAIQERSRITQTASPNAVLGKQTGWFNVKKLRVVAKVLQQKKREANTNNLFVFCEKRSGVAQFRAASNVDFDCTVERMAGLLAMQCLVRGQEPRDFEIMVPAERALVDRLVERAEDLLEEGREMSCPTSLSPRQREVLHSVINNRANKEIASKLNITVRTVKFHISTLLSKFGVETRAELARRATGFVQPAALEEQSEILDRREQNLRQPSFRPMPIETPLRLASKSRSVRFPSRVLTA